MGRVTLKDVADHVGVNVSTASRALSHDRNTLVSSETRRRVEEAARKLGYRGNLQASALRRGRTGIIGVIVADLNNPFIGPVLRGIANALGGRGLLPIMTENRDSSDELAQICDKMLAQRVDGLIITAGRYGDRTLLKRVSSEVPTVLAVRQLPGSGIPAISHDDNAGGRLAAEHLLSLGHRYLAQLEGPEDIWSFEGRAIGFREAVERAGARYVDVQASVRLPTIDAGRQSAERFLRLPGERPTAIFAHNDSIAIGAIDTLKQAGLSCPEDVSIVGFNDVPLTDKISPPLTTVRLPGYDLGRLAAELVLTRIDGSDTGANTVMLTPELVVRQSTAEPASVPVD